MSARFRGLPVSAGRAAGVLHVRGPSDNSNKRGVPEDVTAAFTAVAAQRSALAGRLRAAGRDDEAGIIEVAALIAADPALSGAAADAARAGADPATAITETAERHARLMENLDNPDLAARAADIRQVAAAALDYLRTDNPDSGVTPDSPFILVRPDVSPAELIELSDGGAPLAGAVSVAGGASSHAAIIARGLGLPMIAGADPAVLEAPSGQPALLDADGGTLTTGEDVPAPQARRGAVGPPPGGLGDWASPPIGGSKGGKAPLGSTLTVLVNVASAAETKRGLAAGAEGVGLLRTEIPYLESWDWPGRDRQRAHLEPILAQLAGKPAVVRLLDFSGDKIPPFLGRAGLPPGGGLTALLDHPTALGDQLRAILDAGRDAKLAILIPMVREPAEITRVRDVLARTAGALGVPAPPVGIMVELAGTARRAAEFARAADFFSIGTNDLTGDVLGLSRSDPAAGPALAADPRVLDLVKRVADAGAAAGISVSVCGDAAADPGVLPSLIAAGIRVVSVAAGAVTAIRSVLAGPSTPEGGPR